MQPLTGSTAPLSLTDKTWPTSLIEIQEICSEDLTESWRKVKTQDLRSLSKQNELVGSSTTGSCEKVRLQSLIQGSSSRGD